MNLIPNFELKNIIIFVITTITSYLLFEVSKNKISNKAKHFILSRSIVILIATLVCGFLTNDENLKQASLAFSGVYLGFWLEQQINSLQQRRKLKFFLGMLWQELRYNRVQLQTIKTNYHFFMDNENNLDIMYLKLSGINTQIKLLKSTVYDSFVSSGIITGLENDKIFNDLATAYININYLQSAIDIVQSDFQLKLSIHNKAIDLNGKDRYSKQILEELSRKLKDSAGKEIAIAYRTICIAINSTDSYLNTMQVISSETGESDKELVREDREFIDKILRKTPKRIPKNIFNNK